MFIKYFLTAQHSSIFLGYNLSASCQFLAWRFSINSSIIVMSAGQKEIGIWYGKENYN